MIGLGIVVVVAIVVTLAGLSRRHVGLGAAAPERGQARTPAVPAPVIGMLDRAVEQGVISRETADAIVANEQRHLVAEAAERPSPARSIPALTEAIGYVAASLLMIGMVVLVGTYWLDLQTWSQLAILGAVTVAFFVAGAVLRDEAEPVIWRLRGFVRLLSTGALAGFVGVLTADALEWDGEPVALAIGVTVAVYSAAMWQLQDRPAQHLTTMAGLLIGIGGLMAWLDGQGAVGLSVLALGALWLALAERRLLAPSIVAEALGLMACLVGPAITAGSWECAAPVIGLAVTVTLIVIGSVLRRFVVTGAGVVGLFVYVPYTLGRFFGETIGAPAILLVTGAMLLVVMFVLLRARHGPGQTGTGSPMRPALH